MKTLTVRLPDALVAEIERLSRAGGRRPRPVSRAIADLVGSVKGVPADLSGRRRPT
jgi:predicted transcriptional regulator